MRTAVGIDQAVNAEITVVGLIVKVATVGVVRVGVYIISDSHRVVNEFPDTAAEKALFRPNQIPVFGKVSRAVAHGVRVFAEKQWFGVSLSCEVVVKTFGSGRIHTAFNVDIVTFYLAAQGGVLAFQIGVKPS